MERLKRVLLGKALNPTEPEVFHRLSLVAFLAWIGLGTDGISSSAYGPAEAFIALGGHHYLAIILAVMTAITVFIISASYMQIIELFPSGGGGYLVASKLLSPSIGMVSGCALLVDYVLTIVVSVASGADAIFSFLPNYWLPYKLLAAFVVLLILIMLNLRGIKESIIPIVPIFLLFILTHAAAILYGILTHASHLPSVIHETVTDFKISTSQLGLAGVGMLLLHAYSLGGGTYTGIEAVSNGLPILREPKVETGKRTMIYMAVSLAFMASGLIFGYLLYQVEPVTGKTLNAVLFEKIAQGWPGGSGFVMGSLLLEAMILMVAAQTGFLDGPRVLANMAIDGWMPTRFGLLSDRLVTQNGILLMGIASILLLWISKGSVSFLVVLYSINVFMTFSLSQLGMVFHWWQVRREDSRWFHKLTINGVGLCLTGFILLTVVVVKFHEGGWVTLVVTASLVALAFLIKRHYGQTRRLLSRLDSLLPQNYAGVGDIPADSEITDIVQSGVKSTRDTAIILVNGFNGLGLHTVFNVQRIFRGHFENYIFLQVGLVDVGQFKGAHEIEKLDENIQKDLTRYIHLMRAEGYLAGSVHSLGTDVADEVEAQVLKLRERFPNSVLFAGQLVFPKETIFTRILHNYTAFAIQRRLYQKGIPVQILPIRV